MSANIEVAAHEITRIGQIEEALIGGWAKVPVYYQYVLQLQLPLTEAEFDRVFTRTLRLFITQQDQSCPGIITTTELSSGFEEPFLLLGIGVYAIGEDLSFEQGGALVPLEEGATPGSLEHPLLVDGVAPPQIAGGLIPARLWYGGATWRLIDKFFQSKRFKMRVGRCEIVDEALTDLGIVNAVPVFAGASSSTVPTMPFVRETNDVMSARGMGFKFAPTNTRLIGPTAVTIGPDGGPMWAPWLGPDFDGFGTPGGFNGFVTEAPNAPVTYGHPDIRNLAQRIYCLPQPLLVTPFVRVDLEFETVDSDCCLLPAARKAALVTTEAAYEEQPENLPGGGTTVVSTIPGGCLQIGIVLKGYVCTPRAVADYLINYMCDAGWEAAYFDNAYVAGIINKFELHKQDDLKLKGLVESLRSRGTIR